MYKIKNASVSAALSAIGGELHSLMKNGIEYLWQGDDTYWGGQAPVCFPIVGGLQGGNASAFGKPCRMPRHGVARTEEFELLSHSDDSIAFSLKANENTLKQYPFPFELIIQYQLWQDALSVRYVIKNLGESPMPFALGGHPAFRCPLMPDETFEDYQVKFHKTEPHFPLRTDPHTGLVDRNRTSNVLADGRVLNLRHPLFYEDALIFEDVVSKEITLLSRVSSRGIRLTFENFPHLLIWSSKNDGPFIALEPWSAMPASTEDHGSLENRKGYCILAGEKQLAFTYNIQLL